MDRSTTLAAATTEESLLLTARAHVTLNRAFYDSATSDGNLTYRLPDADGTVRIYRTPGAYTSPLNSEDLAKGLVNRVGQPQMTFNNPTKGFGASNPLARPAAGWFYSSPSLALDNLHGAIDYTTDIATLDGTKDPSFPVYAIASGRVINVYWDFWSGNTVIMEHVAPNGMVYRSIYCHLRNGGTADRAAALNRTPMSDPSNAAADAAYKKYRLFAQKTNPPTIWWGSDSDQILVSTNQFISRGQRLGSAGNTGPGGAGGGLDSTGTPTNKNWANIHLHMFFAVREPDAISVPGVPAHWMLIDPYGAYNDARKASYTPGQPTPMTRYIVGDA